MTLKEKFWNIREKSFTDRMIESEKIADEFAIGFAEWLRESFEKENIPHLNGKSETQLLEIYKKEKWL